MFDGIILTSCPPCFILCKWLVVAIFSKYSYLSDFWLLDDLCDCFNPNMTVLVEFLSIFEWLGVNPEWFEPLDLICSIWVSSANIPFYSFEVIGLLNFLLLYVIFLLNTGLISKEEAASNTALPPCVKSSSTFRMYDSRFGSIYIVFW